MWAATYMLGAAQGMILTQESKEMHDTSKCHVCA